MTTLRALVQDVLGGYIAHGFRYISSGLCSEAADVPPGGASGDWSVASEERGRQILDRMVAYARECASAFLRPSQDLQSRRHPAER